MYIGDYLNDMKHGKGKYTYKISGDEFVGEYLFGKWHKGEFTEIVASENGGAEVKEGGTKTTIIDVEIDSRDMMMPTKSSKTPVTIRVERKGDNCCIYLDEIRIYSASPGPVSGQTGWTIIQLDENGERLELESSIFANKNNPTDTTIAFEPIDSGLCPHECESVDESESKLKELLKENDFIAMVDTETRTLEGFSDEAQRVLRSVPFTIVSNPRTDAVSKNILMLLGRPVPKISENAFG